MLNFPTPLGLRLTLSSLASPHFATSYQLGTVGVVDGSISYLYSSVPLRAYIVPQSDRLPLATLLQSYKTLPELPRRDQPTHYPLLSPQAASLLYGRLYLPQSLLEALVIKRVSPALQLQLSAVSGQFLRNGGTLLGLAQYDVGRYALEGLASSDGGLLGLRGIYNFGGDSEDILPPGASSILGRASGVDGDGADDVRERIYGRFSTGGEIYYGTLNKSGGMSVGGRFATLPQHQGTPLTATLTLNPLMGNVSATYAVVAGRNCSLATKFDFNFYSYESDWVVGVELWRQKLARDGVESAVSAERFLKERSFQAKMEWRLDQPVEYGRGSETTTTTVPPTRSLGETSDQEQRPKERSFQAKMEWRLDEPSTTPAEGQADRVELADAVDDEYSGVIKARLDQNLRIGLVWEGRAKSLLLSLGSGIDLRNLDSPFRTLGAEIQFSS